MPARRQNILGDEPELEFFDHCPTVWDDTKVLRGEIGEYGVIARRSGSDWFIGGMNANRPQEFEIPLTFLDAGKPYVAHIYSDDPTVPTRTHVRIGSLSCRLQYRAADQDAGPRRAGGPHRAGRGR